MLSLSGQAAEVVASSRDVHAATEGLATCVARHVPLVRASLRKVMAGGRGLLVVSVWSSLPTQVQPGMIQPVTGTALPEVLAGDGPIVSSRSWRALLDEVLRLEDVVSWITIPLRRDERIEALLAFSSMDPDVFVGREEGFGALGRSIEDSLLSLMDRAKIKSD